MSDGSKPRPDGQILDHQYDGIQEYDNPAARLVERVLHHHDRLLGLLPVLVPLRWPGQVGRRGLRGRLQGLREAAPRARGRRPELGVRGVDRQRGDQRRHAAKGKTIFTSTCATCHQPDGSGLIGPNLTDNNQKNGSTRMDIYATVRNGVPNTAMVPWGAQLKPAEVLAVAAYVTTLRNHPLPGKAAEGEPVGPFAAP
jgi:cytochrome c oxidase cbb3-type subunit 3